MEDNEATIPGVQWQGNSDAMLEDMDLEAGCLEIPVQRAKRPAAVLEETQDGEKENPERPGKIAKDGFQLNSKQVFLTYPQCEVSKEDALPQFQRMGDVERYLIAEEKHKVGNVNPLFYSEVLFDFIKNKQWDTLLS